MEPTDFEKWCAGEMGHTVEYIMSKRKNDFFGTTGYKLSEIEIRYRAYEHYSHYPLSHVPTKAE